MMNQYVTDYSNHVHQLNVSVSRHLWITRSGLIAYQEKPFEISLSKLAQSKKTYVVHYMIRDHYSGLFYAELRSSSELPLAREFLLRAWGRKEHPFCGTPEVITLPKTVMKQFPDSHAWIESLGIQIIEATSGFQAGVRDLRTWEQELKCLAFGDPIPFETVQRHAAEACRWLALRGKDGERRADRWLNGLPGKTVRMLPPDYAVRSD